MYCVLARKVSVCRVSDSMMANEFEDVNKLRTSSPRFISQPDCGETSRDLWIVAPLKSGLRLCTCSGHIQKRCAIATKVHADFCLVL